MASPSDYDSNQFISLIYDQGPRIGLELSDSFFTLYTNYLYKKTKQKKFISTKVFIYTCKQEYFQFSVGTRNSHFKNSFINIFFCPIDMPNNCQAYNFSIKRLANRQIQRTKAATNACAQLRWGSKGELKAERATRDCKDLVNT